MQYPSARIRHLSATVRECLAALDGAAPDDPEVGRAFDDLATGFADLGDPQALLDTAPVEERDGLEMDLADLARVHAVLTATVSRDRDRLCALLERARTSRGAMRGAAQGPATGGTCDRSA